MMRINLRQPLFLSLDKLMLLVVFRRDETNRQETAIFALTFKPGFYRTDDLFI